ncbi:hypothetical protein [Okeania sp. SIO3B5]|uniref:hypothetical protein n=1 Tax=Okeania sp. SIO3B5 TaxID=2607811 RepID=UPI0034567B43
MKLPESYTSIASFLDGDNLPIYGEKPDDWKPSPKRIKHGLYKSGNNWLINADCNGAANIITKVSSKAVWAIRESPLLKPTV